MNSIENLVRGNLKIDDNKQIEQWGKAIINSKSNREILLSSYDSHRIDHDIKQFSFTLSRYKFVSKMIENRDNINILELGCNHGLGTRFFRQTGVCNQIIGIDFDKDAIIWANHFINDKNTIFIEDNFLNKDYTKILNGDQFDVIVSLDVIEHIQKQDEDSFLKTIFVNLKSDGYAIIGTPNITMSPYASKGSKIGHVNLFDQRRLYRLLTQCFHQVFIFGMNDEVLHTGYYPMSCYIMALCCNKK